MEIFEQQKQYKFYASIKDGIGKISYIETKKRFRNQGIAKKVVTDFIVLCKKENISIIKINAYTKCLIFWEKLGFKVSKNPQIIDGQKQIFHNGVYILK
ncbi:hypothetical protein AMYT_a0058 (plasmid) [Malaciobacter mytili LMG 24559]|nr:GNAT family N-acetyltransferase [Malaciobacter mytili]AXH16358.1 hypothetical protein AMYT_a0058 [Malaciobacter mytili LMG 24559]